MAEKASLSDDFKSKLIAAEYTQKWEYVRHCEKMQNGHINWFLLISGGLFAFVLSDNHSFSVIAEQFISYLALMLVLVYSIYLEYYLIQMKLNHDYYQGRVRELEYEILDYLPRIPAPIFRNLRVFHLRILLVPAIGCICIFFIILLGIILGAQLFSREIISWLGWWGAADLIISIVVAALYLWWRWNKLVQHVPLREDSNQI